MQLKRSTWIILILAALMIFAGIKFAPPYIRYTQFSYFLNNEANDSPKMSNEEIIRDITSKIDELNLPIEPANVVLIEQRKKGLEDEPYVLVERGKDYISITSEYPATVHLVGKYEVTLSFTPEVYFEISADKE
jgi:hypothetical protein